MIYILIKVVMSYNAMYLQISNNKQRIFIVHLLFMNNESAYIRKQTA